MYVLVLLAQSDASAIFEKHLWTHYGWLRSAVTYLDVLDLGSASN